MIRDGELDRGRTVGRLRREDRNMSKKFPECPLYNHNNCKDFHNPKICAVVKKDKVCLRKLHKSSKAHVEFMKP